VIRIRPGLCNPVPLDCMPGSSVTVTVMKIEDLNEEQKGALQLVTTDVLAAIYRGEFDIKEFARRELMNRGRDEQGNWVGFAKSEELLTKKAKGRKKA
jgi:hypothetical protein